MKMLRANRDYVVITAVMFLLVTKITQPFSYWWVAVIISTALIFLEFIELRRSGGENSA